MQQYLDRQLQIRGTTRKNLRVLDVGCGRGDTVAWLCEQGWDAYGVDIVEDYLERGRRYLHQTGWDPERLMLVNPDLSYPIADEHFDIVISDQTFEHVADLGATAAEIARVSSPRATGLHIYPAKWRPVETHLFTPLAHWLPKGPLRRAAIATCLRLRLAAPYFEQHVISDRVEIFTQFSHEETFYRPLAETTAVLEACGMKCDTRRGSIDLMALRLPRLPQPTRPMLGWLYRHFFSVVIHTVKQ